WFDPALGPGSRPRIYRLLVASRSSSAHKPEADDAHGEGEMLEISRDRSQPEASTPASGERPIDLVHLARMTLGDRSLEREVLQLFDRQAVTLIARMHAAEPRSVAAVAHTLKGSARGVGAWQVARAAEAVELAADDQKSVGAAIERLAAAASEAR